MKKNVLSIVLTLVFFAGGVNLYAQWTEYHGDVLPQDDVSGQFSGQFQDKSSLVNGTSQIIVDPDNAENNLWQFDIDLDAADEIQYNWYPSYFDQNDENAVAVPAPSTVAVKSRWIDTAGYYFGIDVEIRETYKVQAKFMNDDGMKLHVKDWNLDSSYLMPPEFDPRDWHVLRLTVANGEWKVYIDEGETAFASGTSGKQVDKHVVIFGAYAEKMKAGVEVDWMGYLEGEASSPSDMPMPAGIFDATKQWEPYDPEASDPTTLGANHQTQSLTVYPNPVGELLTISVDETMVNSDYSVIETSGKIVQSGVISSAKQTIDLASLHSGVYYIKIITGNTVLNGSFIKK
jgi:hypothetical protein